MLEGRQLSRHGGTPASSTRTSTLPDVEIPEGRWLRAAPARTYLAHRAARPARRPDDRAAARGRAAPGCSPGSPWSHRSRERYRVVVFDQRWHGRGIISESFSLHDCADDVAAVITELGLEDADRRRLLDGLDRRPARLAPAPRPRRRAGPRARPPTTSAPTAASGLPRRHGDQHGRAADALEVPDRTPRHPVDRRGADIEPELDIGAVGARGVAQHQPVGGRPGRRRARPAPLDARGSPASTCRPPWWSRARTR